MAYKIVLLMLAFVISGLTGFLIYDRLTYEPEPLPPFILH